MMIETKSDVQTTITSTTQIVGLILAAGKGTRFGGNKLQHALSNGLPMGVQSALNLKPHVDEVICVVRPDDHALKKVFSAHGFTLVDNHEFEHGLSSSIQAGVSARPNADYWLIALGDMPFIQTATYQMVSNAIAHETLNEKPKHRIIRPCLTNESTKGLTNELARALENEFTTDNAKTSSTNKIAGHPVAFPNRFKPELFSLTGDKGAAAIFKQQNEEEKKKAKEKGNNKEKANELIHWLRVDDNGITLDLDQPTDLAACTNVC